MGRDRQAVRDRIRHSGLRERLQSQQATVARSAGSVLILVARPRQMQRRAQLHSFPYNLAFLHRDHWSRDFYSRLWTRSHSHQLLKNLVILRTAIWIAGAVFCDGSDINRARAYRFRPAHRHGKKMRVAKWYVGYGNSASIRPRGSKFIFRHGNLRVRERRSANGPEMIQLHHESMAHAIEIRDRFERLALALLRALSISRMEQRNVPRVVPLPSNRRAHAGVHSPAEKHHGFSAM